MKYKAIICCLCSILSLHALPLIRHESAQPKKINVAYIPQQLVMINDAPKHLAPQHVPFMHNKHYFRYQPKQRKANALELLISHEQANAQLQQLLAKKEAVASCKSVIRLYQRIDGDDTSRAQWQPVVTIPSNQQQALSAIQITPEGILEISEA